MPGIYSVYYYPPLFEYRPRNPHRHNCRRWKRAYFSANRLIKLYPFWAYSLQDDFHWSTYMLFKSLALQDKLRGSRYGIECLFRFYSYGLEKYFRWELFSHFQQIVLEDYAAGQLYGLEKLWALLHYSKHGKSIPLSPELSICLSEFQTIEDFRAKGQYGFRERQAMMTNIRSPKGKFLDSRAA